MDHALAMWEASGKVELRDPLVEFIYSLLRDYLTTGAIEDIIMKDLAPMPKGDHTDRFFSVLMMYVAPLQIEGLRSRLTKDTCQYANGWLARYAQYAAGRIRGEIDITGEG